jgi:hypothetical protein
LSFSTRSGRLIVPLHTHYVVHESQGRKANALDYRAQLWACIPGKNGGHYVVVIMSRSGAAGCGECEYSRLYDPNGRLIATDLAFDARGQPRGNSAGRAMMREVLGDSGPHAFSEIYR